MSRLPSHRSPAVVFAPEGSLPGIPGSFGGDPNPGFGSSGASAGPAGPSGPADPGSPGAPIFRQPAPAEGGGTFELSGWWPRVGAFVIDAIIITAILIPLVILAFAVAGISFSESGDDDTRAIWVFLLILFLWFVAALLYAPITMAALNGATLGKKALGIRVMRADGQKMTFGSAAVREVAIKWLLIGIVSNLTVGLAWLLDVLWPLWDSEHRALHDMLAKTRVVRA